LATADVTVRGGGIFGLCVGWACVTHGARVRLVAPHGIGDGASGGLVGALAPHTPENWNEKKAFQFDSLIMARSYWAGVQSISGQATGYTRSGRLQPVSDARGLELARARAGQADTLWQGQASWTVRAAADFGDWAPHSPTGFLIHDTLSALLHPRHATAALAAAFVAQGGEIVQSAPTEGAEVLATGYAGLLEMSRGRARAVGNGVKGQALLLRHDAVGKAQLFADALHIVPHYDGTVAVGSTSERDFDAPDTTDAQLDAVLERALAAFPTLQGAPVISRWAGVRPRARSRAPMLGAMPGRAGCFVANGGFKIGFGMAPKVGQVMADLILEGRDTIPAEFRVEANL